MGDGRLGGRGGVGIMAGPRHLGTSEALSHPDTLGLGLWRPDAEVTQGMGREGLVPARMPVTLSLGSPGLCSSLPAGKLGAVGMVLGCRTQSPDAQEAQTGAVP